MTIIKNNANIINSSLIIIMIGLVASNLSTIGDVTRSSSHFSVFLCLLVIYAVSNIVHQDLNKFLWTGFTRLPVIMAWIIVSLPYAGLIILLGTGLSYLYKRYILNLKHDIKSYLPIAGNNSASILAIHLTYLFLGGLFPQITETTNYMELNILLIAIMVGTITSVSLIILMQDTKLITIFTNSDKYFVPEVLIIMMSIILPIIFFQLNLTLFVIANGLITVQIFRTARVRRSEEALKQSLDEISTLNSLGSKITSQLSLEPAIETLYSELESLLDADTIYIGLYEEDQEFIEFKLAMVNGEEQDWDKYYLDNNLIGYVLREKQSVCVSNEEAARLLKNLFDPNLLTEAQYMIAPLTVSSKLIGILGVSNHSNVKAFSTNDFKIFQTVAHQASLALRNATLYDRTVRLADNLSVINQSLQDVMFHLDRSTSLETACQIATSVTGTTKAAIFLLEPNHDTKHLLCVKSLGFENIAYIDTHNYNEMTFEDDVLVVNDISKITDPALLEQARLGEFEAFIRIALRSGKTLVGVLEVYHDAPYYYQTTEINLLRMLSNQVTAALDNADLLQALELYAAEQAQLVHLSRIAGGTLDLEMIIYEVCETLSQMMSVERVEIGLWNMERDILRLYSPKDLQKDLQKKYLDINKNPEIDNLLRSNNLVSLNIYHDHEQRSPSLAAYMADNHDATVGFMPMRLEQTMLGLIILGDSNSHIFSDNEQRLLEMATHQITVQIHNALSHTHTQEQLVRGLEQLGLIEDITQQISQALDLDIIIQNVLEAGIQSTHADFASISLPSKNDPKVFDMIWREMVDGQLVPHRILYELESGVVGHVMVTGNTMLVARNDEFSDYTHPEGSLTTYQSSLAVPLMIRDEVIGVLNLESLYPDFFTQEHAEFISSLAGHTAISITNANLFNEREHQINTLNSLRELSLDALQVIRPEDIYNAVLHTASSLLGSDNTTLFQVIDESSNIELLHSLSQDMEETSQAIINLPSQILEDIIVSRDVKFIDDTDTLDTYQSGDLGARNHKSLLIIPIVRRQIVQEILCLGFNKALDFSQIDLSIVNLLSVQVAGHLENASLNTEITNSNDRMRAILNSANDGIILMNNEHQIQDANHAASQLTYTDLDAYLFNTFKQIAYLNSHSEEQAKTWHQIVETYEISPNDIHNQDYTFINDDGDITHVKITVTDVQDEDGIRVGRLLVLRDITEEKKLAKFRETMQSMVLHDLRGPLTSIVTSMYVAENILSLYDGTEFHETEDALKQTLDVSLKSADDMLRQVDTLRDLPMINQMTVDPQIMPAYTIAHTAYESLSANFVESNISMEIDIDKSDMVYVDESLIRRVIVNLLHNAYKFTPVGGKVMISLNEIPDNENYICIQVADNGPGIPESQRERIFGQFAQIEGQKPRTGGKGTGLGLNFCKLAVEAHGGVIGVQDHSILLGACFAFSVPKSGWLD